MTLYGKFFAVIAVMFSLFGCCADKTGKMTDYRYADADFTLTFPSIYGDVVCDGSRYAERTLLTLREPQRSAGLMVEISENSCVVKSGDCSIPLTEKTAEGLIDVIATLFAPLDEPIDASRSSDGEKTIVTTPYGVLYLDSNMLPCAVECKTKNDESRIITVENYVVINTTTDNNDIN